MSLIYEKQAGLYKVKLQWNLLHIAQFYTCVNSPVKLQVVCKHMLLFYF